MAFYRLVHDIDVSIPEEGMTAFGFLRLVRPLVSSVRDGHTTIRAPRVNGSPRKRLWLDFDAASRRLYVSGVYAAKDRTALGARVVAVEGVAFDELVRRQQKMRGFDNDYNNLAHLIATLSDGRGIADILDRADPPDEVRVEVELPDGSMRVVVAALSAQGPGEVFTPDSRVQVPSANAADLGWGFLDEKHTVAYVRIDSAMRYREAFEVWRANGFSRNLEEHLQEVAAAATDGKPPETVDARIAAIPSATDVFGELFEAMRRDGTSTLIVDLRKNGGGNSAIAGILAYYLYGEDGLRWFDNSYQIPRFSDLFFENNSALDRSAYLTKRGIQLGDYDYAEEDKWSQITHGAKRLEPQQAGIEDYEELPTFYRVLKSKTVKPFAPARVTVLTSAQTYSAGFDVAALLYKRGAGIVGVPSAQAGNCFIDSLAYELTHSRLTGSISFKRSLLFPGDPKRGQLLEPDVELTYETLAAMAFDPNAAVALALQTSVDSSTPESGQQPRFVWHGELDGVLPWLRSQYGLGGVAGSAQNEFERLVALRDWVHGRWEHDCCNQPPRFDALSILAEAERGQRFRCVEYAIVLTQVYRAMGYCARFVRLQGSGGAHAVTEVFAPGLGKWILMDGQHAAHVSLEGKPLSAIELRAAVAAGQDLEGHVAGSPIDYVQWVKGMLDYIMVPSDTSYGHELDELVVLTPDGMSAPQSKPAYLRRSRYVTTHDAAAINGAVCK